MKKINFTKPKHHINKPLQLNSVIKSEDQSDDILALGVDKTVKYIPRNSLNNTPQTLDQVLTNGNQSDKPIILKGLASQTELIGGAMEIVDTINGSIQYTGSSIAYTPISLNGYNALFFQKYTDGYASYMFPEHDTGSYTLVSTADLKTVAGESLIGSGDISIPTKSFQNLQQTLDNGDTAHAKIMLIGINNKGSFKANPDEAFIELLTDDGGSIVLTDSSYLNQITLSLDSNSPTINFSKDNIISKIKSNPENTIDQGIFYLPITAYSGVAQTLATLDDITLQKALENNAIANIDTPFIINNGSTGSFKMDDNGIHLRTIAPIPVSIGGNGNLFLSGANGGQIKMSTTMDITGNGLPVNISSNKLLKITGASGVEISEGSSSIKIKNNNLSIGDVAINITSNFITKVHGDGGLQLTSLSPVVIETPAPVDINSLYSPVTIKSGAAQVNLDAADIIDIVKGKLKITGIPVYSDNTDAISNGYEVDKVYKTPTGELRIVF